MRSLIIVSAAAFVLSACTTIQNSLPQVCSAAAAAHSAFVVVAGTGDIKPNLVAKEAAAWAAVEAVCKDPGSITPENALVKAAEAYAAITRALREAKAAK
ncbi:cell wall anchor protein [Ensifer sp. 2YAB10]|uniref:cell wall anchor protein n=1 Tax=unclassified Ensifer TaxID=2633371 RepID=UPI003F908DC8